MVWYFFPSFSFPKCLCDRVSLIYVLRLMAGLDWLDCGFWLWAIKLVPYIYFSWTLLSFPCQCYNRIVGVEGIELFFVLLLFLVSLGPAFSSLFS